MLNRFQFGLSFIWDVMPKSIPILIPMALTLCLSVEQESSRMLRSTLHSTAGTEYIEQQGALLKGHLT